MKALALLIVLACLLAGCGRPLTEAERAFMADLQGGMLDTDEIRIQQNPLLGLRTRTYPTRPRTTCRERIFPPITEPTFEAQTAGMVLFNRLHVRPDVHREDFIGATPGQLDLVAAMFFAHEMTHVWQWQNRAITGYHPTRAFAEHLETEDPYLFEDDGDAAFLDYGYEQQGTLVEEYICCAALDPEGARTERLERLLGGAMPLDPLQSRLDGLDILLPWAGVEIGGICS